MTETMALERSNGRPPAQPARAAATPDEIAVLKATILPPFKRRKVGNEWQDGPPATDEELNLFLAVCARTGLDPFSRQIEAVRYDGDKLTIGPSIHGLRLAAVRSGQYEGHLGPFWCGADGEWLEVWLQESPPLAARVGVRRSRCPEPIWGIATWAQSARTYFKDGKKVVMPRWAEAPADQLAKCAEAAALRKAFPLETAGLGQVVVDSPRDDPEVIDTEGRLEPAEAPAPSTTPTADYERRVRELYEALDGDPRDKLRYRADVNAAMGRDPSSKEPPTEAQWVRCVTHLEKQLAEREAAQAGDSDPFADSPGSGGQRTLDAVEAAEAGTYAQMTGA